MSETPPDDKVVDIRQLVEDRKKAEADALAGKAKPEESPITPKLVKECLNSNELGDGTLYAAIHRGKFLFNKTTAQWLTWRDHHWDVDIMEESFVSVEDVACRYLEAAYALKDQIDKLRAKEKDEEANKLVDLQETYFKRVKKLRSVAGVNNCLTYSHRIKEPLAIKGEEIDTNPYLLACRNGVIDLKTGKLRPGRPEDYLLKAVPHEWQGIDCPAPKFMGFLESSLDGPPDLDEAGRKAYRDALIPFVLRVLGYGITGLSIHQIFLVFNGLGRNGKGILVEILRYVLGSLAGPIPAEMLLDQGRSKSSSGPTPDVMALKGMRLAFASETDEGRRFSPGQVKWYSGGDTLQGRLPHDKRITDFDPTHLLILLTNNLPHAPGDDFAFWDRLKLIPFHYSFVAKPEQDKKNQKQRDPHLRMALQKEAPGILALLVKGWLECQEHGLNPPSIVTTATEEYRISEDTISQFVDDCCIVSSMATEGATNLYKAFTFWYGEHISGDSKRTPKQKKFGEMMKKRFKGEKVGGTTKYYGLELKEDVQTSLGV